jgi:hypothetical protein
MHAQSNSGKRYVHILELHRNLTEDNVRDSIPEMKVAVIEGSEYINWRWIISNGYVPIIKSSPTIVKSTVKDYLYTPEFWTCKCEFDWLHALHYKCETCGTICFYHKDHGFNLLFTTDIWGPGPFEDVEVSTLKTMEFIASAKNEIGKQYEPAMQSAQTIYKHLKYFDFDWVKAFAIENF